MRPRRRDPAQFGRDGKLLFTAQRLRGEEQDLSSMLMCF
jgi:hypothetical protein